MELIYNRIIDLIKNNLSQTNDKCVKFSDQNYKAIDFSRNNFHSIEDIKNNNRKLAFVDSGSAELLKSANFSLSLIRVYYTIYLNNKKIKSKKIDFYSFTKAINSNNELYYETEIFSNENMLNKDDLLLNSMDDTIKQGIARADISTVSNVIRRFSELKSALFLMDFLNPNDMIVLDGSLQCTFTNERRYMDELLNKAKAKNIIISGLSKTTSLMTDKGNSITNALNKFSINGKWLYHPVAEISSNEHKAEMAFTKLHKKSKYIFRFEIYKEQKNKINEVAALLSDNSKDSVFIGYPYGLIEADRNARISNNERSMMQTFFSIKFGKDFEQVKDSLTSTDAHEILDKISF